MGLEHFFWVITAVAGLFTIGCAVLVLAEWLHYRQIQRVRKEIMEKM